MACRQASSLLWGFSIQEPFTPDALPLTRFEEAFRVDGGHTAGTGCRDGLAIRGILYVTGGKDTGQAGGGSMMSIQIALLVHL